MLTNNMFEKVLVNPAKKYNRLQIVSGYATANMLVHHFNTLKEKQYSIDLELIIGMALRDGIFDSHHEKFKEVTNFNEVGLEFRCKYVTKGSPVHAKSFCWYENDNPKLAFVGSANYTRTGFDDDKQIEIIEESDPQQVAVFSNQIERNSTLCNDSGITDTINIHDTWKFEKNLPVEKQRLDSINLSLIVENTGETPDRSGINWGQRPGRDKDQAYLHIPKTVRDSNFFPERGKNFQVMTDDNICFTLVRGQDSGKGLSNPENNAHLGRYLRHRIGKPQGEFVSRNDLENYGRTEITFHKIDNETYLLDFSVPQK